MEIITLFGVIALTVVLIAATLIALVAASLDMMGYLVSEVPFIPVPKKVVAKVVELAPAGARVFYDLGSGEGRVVVAIAKANPNIRAIGIEKAPLPRLLTKLFRQKRPPNAEFIFKDFNDVPLADASYVFMYLLTKVAHRVEPKLKRELKPGARVVCCDFPLKEKAAKEKVAIGHGNHAHTLYVYDF